MAHERSFKNAVKWSYITQGSEQGLNALLTFVFAAILGPKDFGLVAMAMAYILFAKMLLEQGLVPALVQRKDLQQDHLDSVFYFNLAISLGLVAVSVGLSKWWAAMNHLPLLAPVISVLSLAIPIEGLTIVQRAVLSRDMDFKSFSIRSVVAIGVGGVVGLIMAFTHFGVWSLVGKQLTTDFVGLLALWKLGDWRPGTSFSIKALKQLVHFSAGAFAGNAGLFLYAQADALVIGLFFGPVPVGLYRLAARLTNMIVTVATSSLQNASFPQFCRVQDKPAELRQSVLSCLRFAATITIPTLAGLAVVSRLVLAAVGPQWVDANTALKICCLVAMVMPIAYFGGPLLQAKGKPHFVALIVWIQAALTVGSLVIAGRILEHSAVRFQVTGIATAHFITAALIPLPVAFWIFRRFADVRLPAILKTTAPSLLSATIMVSTLLLLSRASFLERFGIWPALISEVLVGAVVASVALLWLDKNIRRMLLELALKWREGPRTPEITLGQALSEGNAPGIVTAATEISDSAVKN
jgi:O-antigen/teichoic acid export membrane protein